MAAYLVSYDLNNPPKHPNYAPIEKRIEEWGGQRVLYSEWLINRNDTNAQAIWQDLAKYVDQNDGLLILALVGLPGGAEWGTGTLRLTDDTVRSLLR